MSSYVSSALLLALLLACLSLAPVDATLESFTYYYSPEEATVCSGKPSDTKVQSCNTGDVIAMVCGDFWNDIHVEGAGKLNDGRFVTCGDGGDCNCFEVTAAPEGSDGNPLRPFVSIAVPSGSPYAFGTVVEVDLLKGLALPDGTQHNGCVRVEDSCTECNMDFYVVTQGNYEDIDRKLQDAETWDVTRTNCQLRV